MNDRSMLEQILQAWRGFQERDEFAMLHAKNHMGRHERVHQNLIAAGFRVFQRSCIPHNDSDFEQTLAELRCGYIDVTLHFLLPTGDFRAVGFCIGLCAWRECELMTDRLTMKRA